MDLSNDVERILWTEEQILQRVSELGSQLTRDFESRAITPVVVGVATGAFMFLADLVRKIQLPMTVDFIRVESYGSGTVSNGKPRISCDLKVDVRGKHVILVEDIIDTGNTLSCLIDYLKSKGASSISVCTLLDKPSRRKVHFELVGEGKYYCGFEMKQGKEENHMLLKILFEFLGFSEFLSMSKFVGIVDNIVKCPDYFVVGYGFDFDEQYRNLPYVGVLKPEIYKS